LIIKLLFLLENPLQVSKFLAEIKRTISGTTIYSTHWRTWK